MMVALLACSNAGLALADDPDALGGESAAGQLEEFFFAGVARVQEKGEVQMTFSLLSEGSGDGEDETFSVGSLEMELGLTDRLQVSVGAPLVEGIANSFRTTTDEVEVGVAYDFSRPGRPTLIAGAELESDDPSNVKLGLASRFQLGRTEIHSGVAVGLGERDLVVDVAGVFPISKWLATLEFQHDTATPGAIRITPGMSWVRDGMQLGGGVGFSSAGRSERLVMLKAVLEF